MTDPARPAHPVELRIRRAARTLEIDFDDGLQAVLPAEYLRVESPSAEVRGHGGPPKLVAAKRNVNLVAVDPIGHYAVKISFSDGHDTGIYEWSFLHLLAREQAVRWQAYIDALGRAGLSRDGG